MLPSNENEMKMWEKKIRILLTEHNRLNINSIYLTIEIPQLILNGVLRFVGTAEKLQLLVNH